MSLDERVLALEKNFVSISHNETILLGMATGMQRDIKIIRADVEVLRSDLTLFKEEVNRRFDSVEGKLEQVLQLLTNRP